MTQSVTNYTMTMEQICHPINVILAMYLLCRIYKLVPKIRFDELNMNETTDSKENWTRSLTIPNTPKQYNWKPDKYPNVLVWRTYTPIELAKFDGTQSHQILFAVNRIVYDVSSGRNFYGPEGSYGNFAGRDASRGLAKQSFDSEVLTPIDAKIDTLHDLTHEEQINLIEWEALFKSKYIACGELIENSERSTTTL